MRHTTQLTLSIALIAACSSLASGAESESRWWPFGGNDTVMPSQATSPTMTPETDSSWFKMPSMPAFKSSDAASQSSAKRARARAPGKASTSRPRNGWAQADPAPKASSPWQSVKSGAQGLSQGTKKAWHKTVDAVTPGDKSTDRLAKREPPKKSWWGRIWPSEEEPQGSRTIGEFMSQERPGQ